MKIVETQSEEEWLEKAIDFIKELKPKTVALSGGTTPGLLYEHWPLDDCEFFQVDERYVLASHSDSNQKMIRATLKPKHFHCFDTSLPIKESLEKYAAELPEQFDLCLLGIGHDGHIASLFPHSQALKSKKKVTHSQSKNFAIENRLSLTLPTILKSKNILVLIRNKASVLDEIKSPIRTAEDFPAHHLQEHQNVLLLFR